MTKRRMAALGLVLVLAGIVLLGVPGYRYVRAIYVQGQMLDELESDGLVLVEVPVDQFPSLPVEPVRPVEPEPAETEPDGNVPSPQDLGPWVIGIPRLKVRAVVVYGVELEDLAVGPGFYPDSPAPGQAGNVAVAGHRTTYGAWFRRLHELEPGDLITLTSRTVMHLYEVESVFVVAKDAWEVVAPTPDPKLTLTTCHPPGSDRQRLVARAGLVASYQEQ